MFDIDTNHRVFYRLNERLCLDFVNTVSYHAGDNPKEWLTTYDKLAQWGYEAGALQDQAHKEDLLMQARQSPEMAKQVLEEAIELREALYRMFGSIVHKEAIPAGDLGTLNSMMQRAAACLRMEVGEDQALSLRFNFDRIEMDSVLWAVVRSAAELLLSPDLGRMKMCESHACGWLFLDMSRNRRRRWCSMDDCGNKEKAKRFYHKKRKER